MKYLSILKKSFLACLVIAGVGLAVFHWSTPTIAVPGTLNVNAPTGSQMFPGNSAITSEGNIGIGITNPRAQLDIAGKTPTLVGTASGSLNQPFATAVQGKFAYVVNYGGSSMNVYDVSNPQSPLLMSTSTSGISSPQDIKVQGKFAYIANLGNSSIAIYDISNPKVPSLVTNLTSGLSLPVRVTIQGSYAYVSSYSNNSLVIFNIGGTLNQSVGSITTNLNAPNADIVVQGNYAYVLNSGTSTNSNSLVIFDVSNPAAPVYKSILALGATPAGMTVQGGYAYVTANSKFLVINVNNPSSPSIVSTTNGSGYWKVKVQGKTAYVMNWGGGVALYDITIPASPTLIKQSNDLVSTAEVSMDLQGRFLYTASFDGNLFFVYDIGGAYIQQLETGSLDTSSVNVLESLRAESLSLIGGVNTYSLNVASIAAFTSPTLMGNIAVNSPNPSEQFQVGTEPYASGTVADLTLGTGTVNTGYLYSVAYTPNGLSYVGNGANVYRDTAGSWQKRNSSYDGILHETTLTTNNTGTMTFHRTPTGSLSFSALAQIAGSGNVGFDGTSTLTNTVNLDLYSNVKIGTYAYLVGPNMVNNGINTGGGWSAINGAVGGSIMVPTNTNAFYIYHSPQWTIGAVVDSNGLSLSGQYYTTIGCFSYPGMTYTSVTGGGGLCISPVQSSATFLQAQYNCAYNYGHLCTQGDMIRVCAVGQIAASTYAGIWFGNTFADDTAMYADLTTCGGGGQSATRTLSKPYYCCTGPGMGSHY